jgi:Rrf2 family protein
MKISTRGRYAIRALLCLAMQYGKGPISLKKISITQKISVKYLENIMRLFINAGIVASSKGKSGGFILSKDPKKIKMGDVVQTAEGNILPICCVPENADCPNANACATKEMWEGLREAMLEYLDSYTLAKLVLKQKYFMKKSGKNSYEL